MMGELVMEALARLDQVAYIPFRLGLPKFPRSQGFRQIQITADDD
jgi:transcriptional regulator NrdR family protein